MSDNKEGIDNLLQLLTQRSGGIEKLLENFFSFLARRTDFYRPPDKSMESSLDHCVNLVSYYCRNVGMKYSELINKNAAAIKSSGSSSSSGLKTGIKKLSSLNTSDKEFIKETTRSDSKVLKSRYSYDIFGRSESSTSFKSSDSSKSPSRSDSSKSIKLLHDPSDSPKSPSKFGFTKSIKLLHDSSDSPKSQSKFGFSKSKLLHESFKELGENQLSNKSTNTTKVTNINTNKETLVQENPKVYDLDDEKQTELEDKKLETNKSDTEETKSDDESTPPPGNGGKNKWYEWTQTLSSLEVLVKLPEGTTSKNLKVQIMTNSLSVKINNSVLFEGQLHDSVKSDECLWALVDNKILQISLEKRNRMNWWSTVIKGHPEIDVKKIVPEDSKLSDLDPETRSTVEKMMFDQRQKAAGLPTSSQQSQYEALERFKKAHPELDFSKANINFS